MIINSNIDIISSVGYEYEFILKEEIDALQIPYLGNFTTALL